MLGTGGGLDGGGRLGSRNSLLLSLGAPSFCLLSGAVLSARTSAVRPAMARAVSSKGRSQLLIFMPFNDGSRLPLYLLPIVAGHDAEHRHQVVIPVRACFYLVPQPRSKGNLEALDVFFPRIAFSLTGACLYLA